jgi:hypothetical protein
MDDRRRACAGRLHRDLGGGASGRIVRASSAGVPDAVRGATMAGSAGAAAGRVSTPIAPSTKSGACDASQRKAQSALRAVLCSGHCPGACAPAGQHSCASPAASAFRRTFPDPQHADMGAAKSSTHCRSATARAHETSRRRRAAMAISKVKGYCAGGVTTRASPYGVRKGGMASGSQSRRIIPVFLASHRLARVVLPQAARSVPVPMQPEWCRIRSGKPWDNS